MIKPETKVYLFEIERMVNSTLNSAKVRYGERMGDYLTAKMLKQLIMGYVTVELGTRMSWVDIRNNAYMFIEEEVLGRTPWWDSVHRDDIYSRYIDPIYVGIKEQIDAIGIGDKTMDVLSMATVTSNTRDIKIINYGDFRSNVWYRIYRNKIGNSIAPWTHEQGMSGYTIRREYKLPED